MPDDDDDIMSAAEVDDVGDVLNTSLPPPVPLPVVPCDLNAAAAGGRVKQPSAPVRD